MNYGNLVTPENVNSGIAQILFLAPVSFIKSIKKPEPPFLYKGAEVAIFENHEFNPGKAFIQLMLAEGKNILEAKTIGDTSFQKFEEQIKCIIPGSYAEQHEFIKNILNTPLIALVKDSSCSAGFFYQLGTEDNPAYLTTDFATGTNKDGQKGYNATVGSITEYLQLYMGQLQLDNGISILQTDEENILVTDGGQQLDIS